MLNTAMTLFLAHKVELLSSMWITSYWRRRRALKWVRY